MLKDNNFDESLNDRTATSLTKASLNKQSIILNLE